MDSDILSLSTGLEVRGRALYDESTGARHQLHAAAVRAVKPLAGSMNAQYWFDELYKQGLEQTNVDELVGFINDIAGWQTKRSLGGWIRVWVTRLIMLSRGYWWQSLARRTMAKPYDITREVLIALTPLAMLLLPAYSVLKITNFEAGAAVVLFGVSLGFVWISTVAHEIAHASLTPSSAVFVRRGLRLGVLHVRLGMAREVKSALFGPLVGATAAGLLGVVSWALTLSMLWLYVAGAVAAIHILSLLPVYGDGRTLFKHRREVILWLGRQLHPYKSKT